MIKTDRPTSNDDLFRKPAWSIPIFRSKHHRFYTYDIYSEAGLNICDHEQTQTLISHAW